MKIWSLESPNQDSFAHISNWWSNLQGQKVQWKRDTGFLTNPSTGERQTHLSIVYGDSVNNNNPVFTMQDPILGQSSTSKDVELCFRGINEFQRLQVQRLELDAQERQLKVTCQSQMHTFILSPFTGGFVRTELS